MNKERQWGTFPFPKNNKMESVLTVSSKTIQLEIRVIMKNQGGGGVRKLFHLSKQTKIKNKKGNKKKDIQLQFPSNFSPYRCQSNPTLLNSLPLAILFSSSLSFIFSVAFNSSA